MIGAAGFTDLFTEFNRKIPVVVDERLRQYQIKNIAELVQTGLSHEKATEYVVSESVRLAQSQQLPPAEEAKTVVKSKAILPLPHTYTAENFLDDCRNLIRSVVEQSDTGYANPLEALVVLYRQQWKSALLHYIDSNGRESTVDFYHAIGSGSPYVRMFFDTPLYGWNKPLAELILLAIYSMAFASKVAKENTVGYTLRNPPQIVGVLPDGRCGNFKPTNMDEILTNIDQQLEGFTELVSRFEPPPFKEPVSS